MGGFARCARKKLTAWSRWLAGIDGIGPTYCEKACKALSKTKVPCAACPGEQLLPENEEVVHVYLQSQTQWQHTAMPAMAGTITMRTGLNYQGVDIVMKHLGVANPTEVFAGVQVIERAMLDIDAERNAKKGDA